MNSSTAVLSSLNHWSRALECGQNVVYFDFKKAFDKAPLAKLIDELKLVKRGENEEGRRGMGGGGGIVIGDMDVYKLSLTK